MDEPREREDVMDRVERELDAAQDSDDQTRLKVLEDLYRALEAEIAQDVPSGR